MGSQKPVKYQGRLRVKNEPPSMEEALLAAECITTNRDEQIEIAATLLGLEPTAEETIKALKAARPRGKTLEIAARGSRSPARNVVVVERKSRSRALAKGAARPTLAAAR